MKGFLNEDSLKIMGLVKQPDGSWKKPLLQKALQQSDSLPESLIKSKPVQNTTGEIKSLTEAKNEFAVDMGNLMVTMPLGNPKPHQKTIFPYTNFITINIKTLTVNQAFTGRRFKTDAYKVYQNALLMLLPDLTIPAGQLKVHYEFGVSTNGFDWDNGIKNLQDCLSKKYRFNDNRIMRAIVDKIIVKKGQEFVRFKIEAL